MNGLTVTPFGARGFGQFWPCAVGRGGITSQKSEGDGATPICDHRIAACLYRADRVARPAPWAQAIGPRDLWCDDPNHPLYNHPARAPFAASNESLARGDCLYDIILTTDWNWPSATPGKGSAIFLHRWRKSRHPTEGCIAFAPLDIRKLAGLLPPGSLITARS